MSILKFLGGLICQHMVLFNYLFMAFMAVEASFTATAGTEHGI